jgi:hypothetical protein
MGYFHEGGLAGFGHCGPSCSCGSCKSGSLSEYYYEGEGRDPPRGRRSSVDGLGEVPGNVTRDIKIVVKSFIAPIGLNAGSPSCGRYDPQAHLRLRAAAAATDAAMRENPTTDAKDRAYRLYTSRTFTVTCNNGAIVSVLPSQIDTGVGLECVPRTSLCLTPPPMLITDVSAAQRSPNSYVFSWTGKGRPPNPAVMFFQSVCPRTSVFIWHRIDGTIECVNGEPRARINLGGSQFPSHRAWINGSLVGGTIPQGPFSNLWVPSPADPVMVR